MLRQGGEMSSEQSKLERFAEFLRNAERIAVLSGAGMSTESGIPDFRSETGLYSSVSSAEIFDIGFFRRHPEKFYAAIAPVYRAMLAAEPNAGHLALAEFEKHHQKRVMIVTQNIDSLHTKAGSSEVAEIHGTFRTLTCLDCEKRFEALRFQAPLAAGAVLRCPGCGGILKPDITFYGEELPPAPFAAAQRAMWEARLLLVLGTSLVVHPAASLPRECDSGIPYVIVNKTETWFDGRCDLVFHDSIGKVLSAVSELL